MLPRAVSSRRRAGRDSCKIHPRARHLNRHLSVGYRPRRIRLCLLTPMFLGEELLHGSHLSLCPCRSFLVRPTNEKASRNPRPIHNTTSPPRTPSIMARAVMPRHTRWQPSYRLRSCRRPLLTSRTHMHTRCPLYMRILQSKWSFRRLEYPIQHRRLSFIPPGSSYSKQNTRT